MIRCAFFCCSDLFGASNLQVLSDLDGTTWGMSNKDFSRNFPSQTWGGFFGDGFFSTKKDATFLHWVVLRKKYIEQYQGFVWFVREKTVFESFCADKRNPVQKYQMHISDMFLSTGSQVTEKKTEIHPTAVGCWMDFCNLVIPDLLKTLPED